jgi:hypothetical protein
LSRFSRRSQGCFGEVGSSRLEASPTKTIARMAIIEAEANRIGSLFVGAASSREK